MSRRHVLLTTDVVGGVWDFSLVLARSLVESADWRVTLLALGSPSPSQARAAAACGVAMVNADLKLEWMQDAAEDVMRTRDLVTRLVRDFRPDVLHANQFAAACGDVDVPVVLSLHSDVVSWHRWTVGASPSELAAAWTGYGLLVREALQRATRLVAVSEFLASEVQAAYGTSRAIEVIYNAWPAPADAADDAPRPRTTLLAGRIWDAAKNIPLAATAAQRLPDPGLVLLAGEHQHPDGGLAAVPPPVHPLGFLDRDALDRCMRQARIYLSPARYDPFGLLPLQAALHGCALLLSDIPSYREVWQDTATYFPPDDPAALAQAWSRLLDDPAQASALARRARTRAQTRYSPDRMRAAYESLYACVATPPAAPRKVAARRGGAGGRAPARGSGGAAPVYGITAPPHVRV